jgi:hypothetical protein
MTPIRHQAMTSIHDDRFQNFLLPFFIGNKRKKNSSYCNKETHQDGSLHHAGKLFISSETFSERRDFV